MRYCGVSLRLPRSAQGDKAISRIKMPNPFEKPYQPSPEEVKKDEELMTLEQRHMNEGREMIIEGQKMIGEGREIEKKGSYELGYKKANQDLLDKLLSNESKDLLEKQIIVYELKMGVVHPLEKATKNQILKFLEEVPYIYGYDVCDTIIDKDILQKIWGRFPNAFILDLDLDSNFDERARLYGELKIKGNDLEFMRDNIRTRIEGGKEGKDQNEIRDEEIRDMIKKFVM